MQQDDRHLREETLGSEPLCQGDFLRAVRDTVRLPDGTTAKREYIKHPGAVMVVPLLDDGRLVLERQFRHPVGQVLIEFPAGKVDAGEDRLACAQRELLEETGYRAGELRQLASGASSAGLCDELITLFLARQLQRVDDPPRDETEQIILHEVPLEHVPRWLERRVAEGAVVDLKVYAALYLTQ